MQDTRLPGVDEGRVTATERQACVRIPIRPRSGTRYARGVASRVNDDHTHSTQTIGPRRIGMGSRTVSRGVPRGHTLGC